jgi:phenylalanyl-tRNA synthetase alpha chain
MTYPSLSTIQSTFETDLQNASTLEALEECRQKYFGRKGELTEQMKNMATLGAEEKKSFGKEINDLKNLLATSLENKLTALRSEQEASLLKSAKIDVSLPGVSRQIGHAHPLTLVKEDILRFFNRMGFLTVDGPEIENEYYNFEALNIPADHPARDSQDSFYLGRGFLLRTQTSPVQIRVMEKTKPPLAIVSPGRVFRRDTLDATHSFMFHQVEGLLVDKGISFAHLKGVLKSFVKEFFGEKTAVRFGPDFFPFTEPSCQISIAFPSASGETRWLEILGGGMVNPVVLKKVGIDPEEYSGIAFGLGLERIAMLKYGIQDIRHFSTNDVRFLHQFY